jgi:hypothetical protein
MSTVKTTSFNTLAKSIKLDPSVINRVDRGMASIRSGSDIDIRNPAFKDKSDSEILKQFDAFMGVEHADLDPRLLELELSNRSKFGPRSYAKKWEERKEGLYESFSTKAEQRKPDEQYRKAIENHYGVFSGRALPLGYSAALYSLPSATAAGLPSLGKKGQFRGLSESDLHLLCDRAVEYNYPSILFTRTQESRKTRNVWGEPFGRVLEEGRYYRPLLERVFSNVRSRSALRGPDFVNQGVTDIFRAAGGKEIVSIDFSSFDATVPSWLVRVVVSVMAGYFQRSELANFTSIMDNITRGGIVTPDGVLEGDHGIPSGSVLTNEIGSMVQVAVAGEDQCQVQGDDGLYIGDLSELTDRFASVGLRVNEEKSDHSSQFAIYLQNYYSERYQTTYPGYGRCMTGVYPVYRALNRLVHLERWTDLESLGITGKDYFAIRAIMIMENSKHHPLFEKLVKFMVANDKQRLQVSSTGLSQYVAYMSKRAPGLLHQHGSDVSGLKSFETYRLIRNL